MDQFGRLELRWAQGYDGGSATYINKHTVCFVCGNSIKFINTKDNSEAFLPSPGDGIVHLVTNPGYDLYAFTERKSDPRIFVYMFPDFSEPRAILKGGAQLSYSSIAFAHNSTVLAAFSGLPDFQLTVWNWTDQVPLCSISVVHQTCTNMSFNPLNWRQLCTIGPEMLTVWNIEQLNEKYKFTSNQMRLPPADGSPDSGEFENLEHSISRMGRTFTSEGFLLTKAAIGGIVGGDAKEFEPGEKTIRCVPVSHCWTPQGKVFCGCSGGQLLSVDTEVNMVRVIATPAPFLQKGRTETLSQLPTMESLQEEPEDDNDAAVLGNKLTPGGTDCLALHKKGLYAGGQDGILRCLDMTGSEVTVTEKVDTGATITSLCWSTDYSTLAIGSSKGSMKLYEPGKELSQLFDVCTSELVGIDCLLG
ncbi:predicted protein, partial [Nematostella vectensis]